MTISVSDCQAWLNILSQPVAIIVAAAMALIWGHIYWRKQKKEEGLYLQKQNLYNERLNAGKALWSLLRYISENDHDDNIFRRGELGDDGDKIFYFRPQQAKRYMEDLNEVFYNKGYGMYLDSETKNLIFELRSQLYAWYHVALKSGKEEMPIKNKEKLKRVWEIRSLLNSQLKDFVKYKE